MAEPQYRFGGPTPEAVKALRARRLGRKNPGRTLIKVSLEPTRLQSVQVAAIARSSAAVFPEMEAEAIMPVSRVRPGFWRRLAARIFRGGR